MNIKPQSFFYCISLAAFSLGALNVIARSVPAQINYQGRLTDSTTEQNSTQPALAQQFGIGDGPLPLGGLTKPQPLESEPTATTSKILVAPHG